ncbi:formate dehydrogenase subunit gamma [Roseivivax isoporae]|uniref:Formate dehydrogenase subunit gamma n=1 Tax=Roseivivax isoporae LMG 25204 TaxID=1449351 RepID=X7F245_9RHOB|nr:formate dehydrogenase subunit gamma [Roseivivax isoporae]ETX26818.1 hypothetical protein RISW2_19030 [Roseivivax isoporae LMG 25204]
MTDIVPPSAEEMRAIVEAHLGLEGPLLPILHAMQDTFGYVPDDAVALIAEALNQTQAEIHGTISFYHDFRRAPAGRHVLRICRAEACQSMGGARLAADTLDRLGVDWHGTTANGAVTVEPVYCLGLCACAPAAMIDGRVAGRLDSAAMGELLQEAGA